MASHLQRPTGSRVLLSPSSPTIRPARPHPAVRRQDA
eukprot:CAMPEP_0173397066 /NCGR_PEP_ID=MMETSP1356-20130122/37286_1 /TAXON_ID=77927 ORGANISM="Hemiselmis virescens, Strain PCC157" /NCGR_SAMPLE_ID=MMETSP1356 /ASSEMBLY_ACC=CAM_ASM_000847 /LENGTH=36 /DNA_ID= /DNA_START= /DNA_END= /DNA_ORIENTATION=